MWSLRVPALLISATLTASSAVLQLQGDNFQSHLETHSPVLVNFCLPWYEPCRNLKPEFEAAAEVLKKRDIACISIDCSLENKTCIANHITSYPTIRIFHGPEKFTRYRNERKAPNIISYMIRDSLPLVLEVTTDNIEEVLLMGTSTLIAYIDEDDQKSRSVFTSFAEAHQNEFIYGITSNLTLAKSNVQKAPFVIVYSPLDQVNPIFKDTFSLDKLEAFANKYSTPLIGTFSLETYYAYTEALPPSSPCTPYTLTDTSTGRVTPPTHLCLHPLQLRPFIPPLPPQTHRREAQKQTELRHYRCHKIPILRQSIESCD